MSKVIFDYNPSTGEIKDKHGLSIFLVGMTPFDDALIRDDTCKTVGVNPIKELVAAGVSVEDILKLKREGAI